MTRLVLYFIGIVGISALAQNWVTQPIDPSKATACEDSKLLEQIKSLKAQVAGLHAAAHEARAESCVTCVEVEHEQEELESQRRTQEDNDDLETATTLVKPHFVYIRYEDSTRVDAVTRYRVPIEGDTATMDELHRAIGLANYYSLKDNQVYWILDQKLMIIHTAETKGWGAQ